MKRVVTIIATVLVTGAAVSACSSSGGAASTGNYCQMIKDYKAEASKFDSVFSSNNPDPAKTKVAFDTMSGMLKDLSAKAPAEIKAETVKVVDATDKIIALLAKNGYDMTKVSANAADVKELQTVMSDTSVSAASAKLDTYGKDKCGIVPDSTVPTATT
jgi:ABC-type oligopeptide transport system substrate-binding subunit